MWWNSLWKAFLLLWRNRSHSDTNEFIFHGLEPAIKVEIPYFRFKWEKKIPREWKLWKVVKSWKESPWENLFYAFECRSQRDVCGEIKENCWTWRLFRIVSRWNFLFKDSLSDASISWFRIIKLFRSLENDVRKITNSLWNLLEKNLQKIFLKHFLVP